MTHKVKLKIPETKKPPRDQGGFCVKGVWHVSSMNFIMHEAHDSVSPINLLKSSGFFCFLGFVELFDSFEDVFYMARNLETAPLGLELTVRAH